MFTGIVEECGYVIGIEIENHAARMVIDAPTVHQGVQLGDSIAINGCCLTVVEYQGSHLAFDMVPETMARTNLGKLKPGSRVNLERALLVGARLGGHFVQGHIDGVGTLLAVLPEENAVVLEVGVPSSLRRYLVEKGSIAVDGVSLTVAQARLDTFTVWTIPHTREVTTLGSLEVGDHVNIECDLLGKYIEKLLAERNE